MVNDIVPTVGMMLDRKWEAKGKKPELVKVLTTATILKVRNKMKTKNAGSAIVFDAKTKKFTGLVTTTDIALKVGTKGIRWSSRVTKIMTPAALVKMVDRTMSVYDCMAIFGQNMGHVPVRGLNGEPDDIITKGDCLFGLHEDSLNLSLQMEGRMPAE